MTQCKRCSELEKELLAALSASEPEEIVLGSPDEVARLKKAVSKAQARAREAEKKSKEIIERSSSYITELTRWRRTLVLLEDHCDKEGNKTILEMYDWYAEFILGGNEEE